MADFAYGLDDAGKHVNSISKKCAEKIRLNLQWLNVYAEILVAGKSTSCLFQAARFITKQPATNALFHGFPAGP